MTNGFSKKIDLLVSYLCILWCVHPKPPVGLPEVVKYNPRSIVGAGRQHYTRRTVRFTGHPGAMEGVGDEETGHHPDKNVRYPLVLGGGGVLDSTSLCARFGLNLG